MSNLNIINIMLLGGEETFFAVEWGGWYWSAAVLDISGE